jgi:hypothetical protein
VYKSGEGNKQGERKHIEAKSETKPDEKEHTEML